LIVRNSVMASTDLNAVCRSEVTIFGLKGTEVIVVDFWIVLEAPSTTARELFRQWAYAE
jgi:hypothetical protein